MPSALIASARDSALMACANTLAAKKDFVRNKVMSLAVVPSVSFGRGRLAAMVGTGCCLP